MTSEGWVRGGDTQCYHGMQSVMSLARYDGSAKYSNTRECKASMHRVHASPSLKHRHTHFTCLDKPTCAMHSTYPPLLWHPHIIRVQQINGVHQQLLQQQAACPPAHKSRQAGRQAGRQTQYCV
jgi:hypothetical protein